MDRWSGVIVIALLLGCSLGALTLVSGADAGADTDRPRLTGAPGDFSRTSHILTVYDNGSVRWTNRHTKPLEDDETDAYESFAAEFNSTEMALYEEFRSNAQQLTSLGTNTTGRQMDASAFSRRAFVSDPDQGEFSLGHQGVVEMSFTWSNLTVRSGDRLVLGDVFTNGLYLGPNREIVVEKTDDLQFLAAEPTPDSTTGPTLADSDSITWEGETDFNPGKPSVTLAPESSTGMTPTPTPTRTQRTTTTNESNAGGGGSDFTSLLPIVLVLLVLVAGTALVWFVVRDGATESDDGTVVASSSPGSDDGSSSAVPEDPGDTGTEAQPAQEPAISDDELLSDTDRVHSLLEENGGRMRQSVIVEETEWSKSKVSMLLTDMEDEDEVTKLRVGRENIISLPGHEPEAAGSPFEDEE